MSDLFEQLAAIEHERWADWQRDMHGKGHTVHGSRSWAVTTGDLILPSVLVEQWERQINTPYAELSEKEKDSDRDQVHRYWYLLDTIDSDKSRLEALEKHAIQCSIDIQDLEIERDRYKAALEEELKWHPENHRIRAALAPPEQGSGE